MLNALAEALPELVGGSADLGGSNCTNLKVGLSLCLSVCVGFIAIYIGDMWVLLVDT